MGQGANQSLEFSQKSREGLWWARDAQAGKQANKEGRLSFPPPAWPVRHQMGQILPKGGSWWWETGREGLQLYQHSINPLVAQQRFLGLKLEGKGMGGPCQFVFVLGHGSSSSRAMAEHKMQCFLAKK